MRYGADHLLEQRRQQFCREVPELPGCMADGTNLRRSRSERRSSD